MENIEKDFNEKINLGTCIVDFWAEWCGPCKMFGPIFEKVSKENNNFNFYKYNVDNDYNDVCKKLGIMSIPTMIIFKDGKEIRRNIGFLSEENLKTFLGE